MAKFLIAISFLILALSMVWAADQMTRDISSTIRLEPYSGPGYGVYAPGTVIGEDGTYSGKLDIDGVWIVQD